ncbi:E3 ubiquitin-protein ligase TRIM21-like [Dromiciops gliroides]|uniref:E3 ubiquitin-protein ligase TRIM21-like n=1 Tax=Dromiciops gliroides TaxID=33562 RepID=UPI001CC82D77|nr:E3 ubiquitin-protein ligase TRIM21-like [Dromiciops gliroides]
MPGKELSCQLLQSAEGQHQCATHKKVLKLFCEDDQRGVCVRCSQSPDHGAHMLFPVEEAAHRCREKLQHILIQVRKKVEEVETLLAQEKRPDFNWHWMITAEYCKLHEFLLEEESRFLERMKQEQRATQDRISQNMQRFQKLMLDLQEAGHQPNVEMLQDVKQLLGRNESVLSQRAKAITPLMREYAIPVMREMWRQFRVDITMDPKSSCSYVTVSDDLKSVKAGEGWQVDIENSENFPCHSLLGKQAFSSGRQYWEVDVSQLPQWILEIYTPYLRRKRGRNVNSYASVFLLQCVKKEDNYYLQTYPES